MQALWYLYSTLRLSHQSTHHRVWLHYPELLAQKHILFVEDNRINQRVGMRMLQALGCRAKLASNGEKCLAAMAKKQFDLILMDCQVLPINAPPPASVSVPPFFRSFNVLFSFADGGGCSANGRCR